MEFRLYWQIIKKRSWLIVILMLLVAASYALLTPRSTPTYVAHMRFVVGLKPEVSPGNYTYDRYYTWLTAEYLLDDLSEVVKSGVFARDVAAASGLNVGAGAIKGATSAGKLHRILSVQVTWPNPEELALIANAVVEVLQHRCATYFAQLATENAVIAIIDPPVVSSVGASLRQKIDLPLRLILALAAGIALAFLFDYCDSSIRGRADLESLGLPILAEIPPRRRRFLRRRQALP